MSTRVKRYRRWTPTKFGASGPLIVIDPHRDQSAVTITNQNTRNSTITWAADAPDAQAATLVTAAAGLNGNRGLDFDGTDDAYICAVEAVDFEGAAPWHVMLVVDPDAVDNTIFGKIDSAAGDRGWRIYALGSTGNWGVHLYNDDVANLECEVRFADASLAAAGLVDFDYTGSGDAAGLTARRNNSALTPTTIRDLLAGLTILNASLPRIARYATGGAGSFWGGVVYYFALWDTAASPLPSAASLYRARRHLGRRFNFSITGGA